MSVKQNRDLKKIYEQVVSLNKEFFTYPSTIESVEIFKELDSWEGLTVLEIGCGTGQLAAMIASGGAAHVTACDFSNKSIEKAMETFNLDNLTFMCQDVNEFQVNEKFDVVVLQGVLEHLDEPFQSLKYFADKFMKPGGMLITSSPAFYNPRGYVWMTLALLFDVPMSLTDLHFLNIKDFIGFAEEQELKLHWRSIHQDWGSGDGLIKDFKKRLVNALRDAKMPNENVGKLLEWLEHATDYFERTNDTGAEIIYVLRRDEKSGD